MADNKKVPKKFSGNKAKLIWFIDTESNRAIDGIEADDELLEEFKSSSSFSWDRISISWKSIQVACLQSDFTLYSTDRSEIVEWFSSLTGHNIIYLFNAKWDVSIMSEWLHDAGFVNEQVLASMGNIISAKFGKNGSEEDYIEIRDLTRLIPNMTLKDASIAFNKVHFKKDYDIHDEEYAMGDVLATKELYQRFLTLVNEVKITLGLSNMKKPPLTMSALTEACFLEAGYKSDMGKYDKFHDDFGVLNQEDYEMLRPFYRGGHGIMLQPSYIVTPTHYYTGYHPKTSSADKISAYPYEIMKPLHPTVIGSKRYKGFKEVTDERPFCFYIVDVKRAFIKPNKIPSVMLKGLDTGKSENISYLMNSDEPIRLYLIDIKDEMSEYDRFLSDYISEYTVIETFAFKGRPLTEGAYRYVTKLYELKDYYDKQGMMAHKTLVKLLLNALYGKFGKKFLFEKNLYKYDSEDKVYRMMATGERDDGYDSQMSVVMASVITERVRLSILEKCDKIGHENVIMTATDSITVNVIDPVVREKFYQVFNDPHELGAFDIEHEDVKMVALGSKSYQKETKKGVRTKCAGLSAKTAKTLINIGDLAVGEVYVNLKRHTVLGGSVLINNEFYLEPTPNFIINPNYGKDIVYVKKIKKSSKGDKRIKVSSV